MARMFFAQLCHFPENCHDLQNANQHKRLFLFNRHFGQPLGGAAAGFAAGSFLRYWSSADGRILL
jgi:hypothetical protein